MANEITVTSALQVQNGNLRFSNNAGSFSVDQANAGGPAPAFRTVTTVEVSESFSALTTEGWCMMRNLDATNYVEWGFSAGVYGGRMEAGETALFRLNPAATLYLRANTADCDCVIYALED